MSWCVTRTHTLRALFLSVADVCVAVGWNFPGFLWLLSAPLRLSQKHDMPPYSQNIPLSCHLTTIVFLYFSSIIPLMPPFLPLQEVKWWHLLQAVITVWFQYSKWAISLTTSGRCSLPCPININTHTHRGESSLICMERGIVQVRSCGREGVMNFWWYLIILTLLCVCVWCCCICIFPAVLSPSCLFTIAWLRWEGQSPHMFT